MSRDMCMDPEPSNGNTDGTPRYQTNGFMQPPNPKGVATTTQNGYSHLANGHSSSHMNGSGIISGHTQSASFFGHDREEVSRIIIQALNDLGYTDAASRLIQESGHELESPSVAAFRHAILGGEWSEAEALLFGSHRRSTGGGTSVNNGRSYHNEGLVLAEGVDKDGLRFLLRKQKYLELLEVRDHGGALMVLRQELTPLHQDVGKLHALSGLMVCQSPEELKSQASWDGAQGTSRSTLLADLSKSISPSVMLPDHRLAALLDQVKKNQVFQCTYHNPITAHSLFSDHVCDRSQFPLQAVLTLQQNEEVWFLEFSHDGRRLATCGKDLTITVYDTMDFEVRYKLTEHTKPITYLAWSPDDTKLISCSTDHSAKVWDMSSGQCMMTVKNGNEPVTSAAWAPDGQSLVTASMDHEFPLVIWDLNGGKLHTWSNKRRVVDLALTPDGQRLVTLVKETYQVSVYNFATREEEYTINYQTEMTCVNISRDSKYMLINMVNNELQLINIETAALVRTYTGQKQGNFIIRSTFGGTVENLVISGSEDGRVYIWHRENGKLIEELPGHGAGAVSCVAWNPADTCMFASAGDDKKVKIWSKEGSNATRRRHSSNGSYRALMSNRLSYDAAAAHAPLY